MSHQVFCTAKFWESKIKSLNKHQLQWPSAILTVMSLKKSLVNWWKTLVECHQNRRKSFFWEDGPEILIGVGSGTYKVDLQLSKRPTTILAVNGHQINQSFRGIKKICFKCFGVGHIANVCKKEKASWEQYKMFLMEKFGLGAEFIFILSWTPSISRFISCPATSPIILLPVPWGTLQSSWPVSSQRSYSTVG